jgi:hypothetical protein
MGRNPPIFAASDEYDGTRELDGSNILSASIESNHHESGFRQVLKYRFQIVGARDGKMGQRAGGGFLDNRSQAAAAFTRQNQSRSPHSNRGSSDSTQIPRVFDGSPYQYDGLLSCLDLFHQGFAQLFPFHEFANVANCDHALMTTPAGSDAQFPWHQLLAGNTGFFGHFLEGIETRFAGSTLQKQSLDSLRLSLQQSLDGMLATNHFGRIFRLWARWSKIPGRTRLGPSIREIAIVGTRFATFGRTPIVEARPAILLRSLAAESAFGSAVQERTFTVARVRTASTNCLNRYSES